MGVLRIRTDKGIEGTNFLSYPGPGPEAIAREIVKFVKPLLRRSRSAADRASLASTVQSRPLHQPDHGGRRRRRPVGYRGPGCRATDPPAARQLPGQAPCVPVVGASRDCTGLCRRGGLLARAGVAWVQAPPAARAVAHGRAAADLLRHRRLYAGPRRGGRRDGTDARSDLELLLRGRTGSRVQDRGARVTSGTRIRSRRWTSTATVGSNRTCGFR